MKLAYSWVALFVLLSTGCKKELQPAPSDNDAITQTDDYTICTSQWASNISYEATTPQFFFVYDNKYYAPQNAGAPNGDMQVHIFDGTNWTHIPCEVPLFSNIHNFAFVVGSKGYAARCSSNGTNRFYEYNFATNTWTRKADFPGTGYYGFATFNIGTKGYVAGGSGIDGMVSEVWEYNPSSNTWRARASLPQVRSAASGFAFGGKGYVVNGMYYAYSGLHRSLMEYDPVSNSWATKSTFPGPGRLDSKVFVIDDYVYIGGGHRFNPTMPFTDYYRYDPAGNNWTSVKDAPVSEFMDNGFSINGKGYAVYWPGNGQGARMVKFYPRVCGPFVQQANAGYTGN
ncbi:MAG: hypothetical protein JNK14_03430 [Chitinophagaceae bacterium]|nr:hypothetical protein [Chitinophagaceae bacterium]